ECPRQLVRRARSAHPEASLCLETARTKQAPAVLDVLPGDVEALEGERSRARTAKRRLAREATEGSILSCGIVGQECVADDDRRPDLGDDLDPAPYAGRGQQDQRVGQILHQ